ncbi:putative stress-induced-phosphoprotein 1 [Monocercomonoides exilis]|uniref:putative stress-induced-phosphoprotein 1 n=1 Tax=Monocercomonoides exilis TaxID=2049356 RepID=UPI00355ABBBD|nr:putative stress-induced-phosphoprotein 1 [Monocercomonoides exilis]|eukprot:MONOS_9662.1-p1 / transcript=MONOS_9662.1 / gene=MONOS_9662 / organism=Monocercomonoides_exilis_PA203 / gene_product=stress-induced-phosphoprotein 1 / transcript_product=stress-induced-phosphoprotein 1 / location=Mono_scaffold00407:11697-14071(+) / protein_length=734 / sequence_SO=supercontig / SO=protein_coding / is_pseudo=false
MAAEALELKTKGNNAFSSGDYDMAVDFFTQAIRLDPNNHVLYSNRSAAYAQLSKYNEALEDAEKCVEINPAFVKGYSRKGAALYGLHRLEDAKKAYEAGLEKDPNNAACKEGIESINEIENPPESAADKTIENLFANVKQVAMNHPKLKSKCSDPAFMQKLENLQSNPKEAFTTALMDPELQPLIAALLNIPDETFEAAQRRAEEQSRMGDPFPHDTGYGSSSTPYSSSTSSSSYASTSSQPPKPAAPTIDPNSPIARAIKEKEIGNDFYKKKKFDEAIVHYERAIQLDPHQMSFHLNRAACFVEMANAKDKMAEAASKSSEEQPFDVEGSIKKLQTERDTRKQRIEEEKELRRKAKQEAKESKNLRMKLGKKRKVDEDEEEVKKDTISADDEDEEEGKQKEIEAEESEEEIEKEKMEEDEEEKESEIEEMEVKEEAPLPTDIGSLIEYCTKEKNELYEMAMKSCEVAIDISETHRERKENSDEMRAKAFLRMCNIEIKRKRYPEAERFVEKSLLEHRTDDAVKKQKELKELIKKKEEEDYLDDAKGEEARLRGNDLFASGQFAEAIKEYTDAIKRNPKDVRTWSNRAACHTKLMNWSGALDDCDRALKLDPKFIKAYVRKAKVQIFLKQFPQAMKTIEAGMAVDSSNQDLIQVNYELMKRIQESQQDGKADEQQIQQAMQDPEIRAILQDPVMQNVLNEMQTNPMKVQEHMRNPKIANALGKLVAAGIIKTR